MFGRFRVLPHRRELLADGQPVMLGGRAYDVLMMLIEAQGAIVSKDALMARVWPDRVVEENALEVQVSTVRGAFGADRGLIRTVSGRGYQFTGEIRTQAAADERVVPDEAPVEPRSAPSPTNLPERVSEFIGRDEELRELLSLVAFHRHPKFNPIKHMIIPVLGLLANLACMAFYLIGPFMGYGTKMEPLLALGIAAVWGIYGGIYFIRASKKTGRTTLVTRGATSGAA